MNQADGGRDALVYLSDDAFLFFLPAFLIADLRGELSHTDPAIRLCNGVTLQSEGTRLAAVWGGGTLGERSRQLFRRLSGDQRASIVDYLLWKLAGDGNDTLTIEHALERYWLADD